jgi:hypothetical protein
VGTGSHRELYEDASAAARRRPAHSAAPTAALLRLQRAAGNRAVASIVQRRADVTAEDVEAWSADYTEASNYVIQWYERTRAFLDEKEKAQKGAEENFKSFKDLKDPPDLGLAILKSIFKAVIGMLPGAAALITGMEVGSFITEAASDHGAAAKDEKPKEAGKPADEHAEGGGRLEKGKELGMKGAEGGKEVYATYKETKAKIREAQEAEENAKLFQQLAHQRISSWADLTKRAFAEEKRVLEWLAEMQRSKHHRGGLLSLVRSKLGPQLPDGVSGDIALELSRSYELELFRKYFKEKKAELVGVTYWSYQDEGPIGYSLVEEGKNSDLLTKVVRHHIIEDILKKLPTKYLGGWAEDLVRRWGYDVLYDDYVLARVFGLHYHKRNLRGSAYWEDGGGDRRRTSRELRDYFITQERPELTDVTRRMRLGLSNETK